MLPNKKGKNNLLPTYFIQITIEEKLIEEKRLSFKSEEVGVDSNKKLREKIQISFFLYTLLNLSWNCLLIFLKKKFLPEKESKKRRKPNRRS